MKKEDLKSKCRLLHDPKFEYIKAAEHNTTAGLNEFRRRQEKRRLEAQGISTKGEQNESNDNSSSEARRKSHLLQGSGRRLALEVTGR